MRAPLALAWLAAAAAAVTALTAGARALRAVDDCGSDGFVCAPGLDCTCSRAGSIFWFRVNGSKIQIDIKDNDFEVKCNEGPSEGWESMVQSASARRVREVAVLKCALPARGSLIGALAALNVTLLCDDSCALRLQLRAPQRLEREQLAGLRRLRALRLRGGALELAALSALPALRELRLFAVQLPTPLHLHDSPLDERSENESDVREPAPEPDGEQNKTACALPALEVLSLELMGVEQLRVALRGLRSLAVTARGPLAVHLDTPRLRALLLHASRLEQPLHTVLPPALRNLTLAVWAPAVPPAPLRDCGQLRHAELTLEGVAALPARWLAACGALRSLVLRGADGLTRLPPDWLWGAAALVDLRLQHTSLAALPSDLLHHTPDLSTLWLTDNVSLKALPSAVFDKSGNLTELMLLGNDLTEAAAAELQNLSRLRKLSLESNKRLGDLCFERGSSQLAALAALEQLELAYTRVSHLCADWRQNMPRLSLLDLSYTRLRHLQSVDLSWKRDVQCEVRLEGANVTRVFAPGADSGVRGAGGVTLRLDREPRLECDCRMHDTWRAASGRGASWPARLRVEPLSCGGAGGGRALAALAAHEVTCGGAPCPRLPAGCACGWHPLEEAPAAPLQAYVRCADVRWEELQPQLQAVDCSVDVRLRGAALGALRREQLPRRLRILDAVGNGISTIDRELIATLGSPEFPERRLLLAQNPLQCGCEQAGALQLLRQRAAAVPDYHSAVCDGDGALDAARPEPCARRDALLALAVAGPLLALLLAVALVLLRREPRLLVKALLLRGGLWRRPAPAADGRRYDAFVSFAHEDRAAALELVRRLEALSYRLCVHYRDWAPGRAIPEQIGESVASARRTVALVSKHSLASAWARAEVREARAAAARDGEPRLLVVLLAPPARLPLDSELRRYLSRHTYVRWADPWLWDKLLLALPPPSAAPAAAAPAAAAPTAAASAAPAAAATAAPAAAELAEPARVPLSLAVVDAFCEEGPEDPRRPELVLSVATLASPVASNMPVPQSTSTRAVSLVPANAPGPPTRAVSLVPANAPGPPTRAVSLVPANAPGPPTRAVSLVPAVAPGPPTPAVSLVPAVAPGPPTPAVSLVPAVAPGPPAPPVSLVPAVAPGPPTPAVSLVPAVAPGPPAAARRRARTRSRTKSPKVLQPFRRFVAVV